MMPRPGLHPPRLGSLDDKGVGKRLLALIRSLENEEEGDNKMLQRVLVLLNDFSVTYSIRGLLQGDESKAEKILTSFGANSTAAVSQRGKHGRKKATSTAPGLKLIQDGMDGNDGGTNKDSINMDATLVLSALVRAFNVPNGTSELPCGKLSLIVSAANVCTAICDRINSLPTLDTCALAEYELVASHGKPLLVGLSKVINIILAAREERPSGLKTMETPQMQALTSCLRASSSLMSLLGVKLSRNATVLTNLRQAGWECLAWPDSNLQQVSALLITATILTGGPDKLSLSELWTKLVTDCLSLMSKVLNTVLTSKQRDKKVDGNRWPLSTEAQQHFTSWHDGIRQLPSTNEEGRVKAVLPILDGIAKLIISLFVPAAGDQGSAFPYVDAKFSLPHMLDVLETMLTFPVAAENSFYSTKKRLRSELLDNGWLNPITLVTYVANHVKLLGCEILETVITSVGGPSLLPYGCRLLRMTHAALSTAVSSALRKVLDPAGSGRLDGKRRRWLHTSIRLRTASIRALKVVITALGPNSVNCTMQRSGSVRGREAVRAISLTAGSLLEQITWPKGGDDANDYGSVNERGELAREAADTLSACLNSCGPFLPMETRSLIDSVATTALSSIFAPRSIAAWSLVKVAILELASSCLTTPWPDGAASSLMKVVLQAADRCVFDHNHLVSTKAKEVLHIIQGQVTPHAPPLLIVTRATDTGFTRKSKFHDISSATAIIDELGKAHKELAQVEKKEKASQEQQQQQQQQVKQNSDSNKKRKKIVDANESVQPLNNGIGSIAGDEVMMEGAQSVHEQSHQISKLGVRDSKVVASKPEIISAVQGDSNGANAAAAQEDEETSAPMDEDDLPGESNEIKSKTVATKEDDEDEDDDDDDVPIIVDVGPDEDDM